MGLRIKLLYLVFLIVFIGLIARLFNWQVLRAKELANDALGQRKSGNILSAPRGNILAADGTWLVARKQDWQVFATPKEFKKKISEIATLLAPFFVDDDKDQNLLLNEENRLKTVLSKDGITWISLKHRLDNDSKKKIEALGISGIGFDPEEGRDYPEASASAHLLGFVGKTDSGDDKGYFGLEGFYDSVLSGKPGFASSENDAKGIPIILGNASEISSINGVDLVTNIDKTIQLSVEQKLKEGIEKYGAKGGTAIVMDPHTGAILGMASYPSYDPSKYWEFGNEYFKNPAVSDTFEPGSVFKIVVMAAGIDSGAVTPETICDICGGPLKVDKYSIETWNREYHPDSTMEDIIVHSDNVGMAFVGNKLGADKLYDYLNKFGIGNLTGIDLQGEVTAKLREKGTWNIVDLATSTFGQGIAVTPIQMLRAAAVIANDGRIVTPQVVKRLEIDSWSQKIEPVVGDQVISKDTAEKITNMMIAAAAHGEAKWTNLKGFKVAGKTGTAQIPISGHYDAEKTIGSFVGFAPADNPRFIMLVTLKEPQTSIWASETAAPLWYSIAKDLFSYFGIQPEQ